MTGGNTWALILAAGDGMRLSSLTTTANGQRVPKQFCSLRGGASLLEGALTRAATVASRGQRMTVVADNHRCWWERSLSSLPPANVIVQPQNRGTAAGLLLPLLHILLRDPDATVLVLPSDHFFHDEPTLAATLRRASLLAQAGEDCVYLLGLDPEGPDPELGYIVPRAGFASAVAAVERFVEKPPAEAARTLIAGGALLNMFILAAPVRALVDLYAARQPALLALLREVAARDRQDPQDARAARQVYPRLPSLDFSRDILEGMEQRLRVLAVPACGWSDLGTPRRVIETLARLGAGSRAEGAGGDGWLNLADQHRRLLGTPFSLAHA